MFKFDTSIWEITVFGQFVCYLIKKVLEAFDGYP